MRKKLKTTSLPRFSPMEEDLVLAEIENVVNNYSSRTRSCYDVTEGRGSRRLRKRYSAVVVTAIAVAAVMLPAGFVTGQLLALATHRAAAN